MNKNSYFGHDDSPLCCCEYENEKGERSHLLALFCDCQELDDGFDRIFRGQKVSKEKIWKICHVIEDRIRIPWKGGAQRLPLGKIVPILFVPIALNLAKFGAECFILVHVLLIALFFFIYRHFLKERPKSNFYPWYSISTACYLFYVYQVQVVGIVNLPKTISFYENLLLTASLFISFLLLKVTRAKAILDRRRKQSNENRFCRVCRCYIVHKDHHCIWIKTCVSKSNKTPFALLLGTLFFCSLYYSNLLLTSVCQSKLLFYDLLLIPSNCLNVNPKFMGDSDLVFACGLHSLLLSILILIILITTVITKTK